MTQSEKNIVWLASVVSMLVWSTTALAQASSGDATWQDNLDISAIVGATYGQNNFVGSRESDTGVEAAVEPHHNAVSLALGVGYTVDQLEFSASTAFVNIEQSGGIEPSYQWRETFLGARWHQRFLDEQLRVSPFLDVALPTGEVDWDAELIFAPIVGADIEYTFADRMTLGLGASFRRNVHNSKNYADEPRTGSATVGLTSDSERPRVDALANVTDVTRPGASLTGPYMLRPTAFELVGKTRDVLTVGGGVSVEIVDPLAMKVGYAYHRFSGYVPPPNDDPFRPDISDGANSGDSEAPVAEIQTATVDVIYTPIPEFGVGGGIATSQLVRGLDGESWRFPLWNTNGAMHNWSKIRLYVEYRY